MTIGEYFIFGFVSVIFFLGLYLGIRLFKWNQETYKKNLKKKTTKIIKINTCLVKITWGNDG